MPINTRNRIRITNADDRDIMFRNFSGGPTRFNQRGGVRTFTLRINDEEMALDLKEKGWYVKTYIPENGDPQYSIKVNVRYDKYPPVISIYSHGKEVTFDREDDKLLAGLDMASIERCDITIQGSYNPNRPTGEPNVSAYLQRMRIKLMDDVEDEEEEAEWAEMYLDRAETEHPTEDSDEDGDLPF